LRGKVGTVAGRGRGKARRRDHIDEIWREYSDVVADAIADNKRRLREARDLSGWQVAYLENGHVAARNESWDAGAGRFGVRYWHPLEDPRVLEVALSAPPRCFAAFGWDRLLMRAAAVGLLPDAVVAAPKLFDPAATQHYRDLRAAVDAQPVDPDDPVEAYRRRYGSHLRSLA
jgi:hypothetical protein